MLSVELFINESDLNFLPEVRKLVLNEKISSGRREWLIAGCIVLAVIILIRFAPQLLFYFLLFIEFIIICFLIRTLFINDQLEAKKNDERIFLEYFNSVTNKNIELRFGDNGVDILTEKSTLTYNWITIEVMLDEDFLGLTLKKGELFFIPRRSCVSDDDFDKMTQIVRNKAECLSSYKWMYKQKLS